LGGFDEYSKLLNVGIYFYVCGSACYFYIGWSFAIVV
jgi:hypothetical protein